MKCCNFSSHLKYAHILLSGIDFQGALFYMGSGKAAQGQTKAISVIWLVFPQINLNEQEAAGESKIKLKKSGPIKVD